MTEMVERVARAIYDADPIRDKSMAVARKKAIAAIEAMREPTDDMIYVGEGYCDFMLPSTHDNTGSGRRKEFRMGWQAAIDHALKP